MSDLIERLRGPSPSIPAMRDAADEIERLRQWEIVGREWLDKTDWMQSKDAPVRWLGKHRADALRDEIERLTAERDELRRQLADMRAALAAAMEIVQTDRMELYYGCACPVTGKPSPEDDAALALYDAVIAQADAALGADR